MSTSNLFVAGRKGFRCDGTALSCCSPTAYRIRGRIFCHTGKFGLNSITRSVIVQSNVN